MGGYGWVGDWWVRIYSSRYESSQVYEINEPHVFSVCV